MHIVTLHAPQVWPLCQFVPNIIYWSKTVCTLCEYMNVSCTHSLRMQYPAEADAELRLYSLVCSIPVRPHTAYAVLPTLDSPRFAFDLLRKSTVIVLVRHRTIMNHSSSSCQKLANMMYLFRVLRNAWQRCELACHHYRVATSRSTLH